MKCCLPQKTHLDHDDADEHEEGGRDGGGAVAEEPGARGAAGGLGGAADDGLRGGTRAIEVDRGRLHGRLERRGEEVGVDRAGGGTEAAVPLAKDEEGVDLAGLDGEGGRGDGVVALVVAGGLGVAAVVDVGPGAGVELDDLALARAVGVGQDGVGVLGGVVGGVGGGEGVRVARVAGKVGGDLDGHTRVAGLVGLEGGLASGVVPLLEVDGLKAEDGLAGHGGVLAGLVDSLVHGVADHEVGAGLVGERVTDTVEGRAGEGHGGGDTGVEEVGVVGTGLHVAVDGGGELEVGLGGEDLVVVVGGEGASGGGAGLLLGDGLDGGEAVGLDDEVDALEAGGIGVPVAGGQEVVVGAGLRVEDERADGHVHDVEGHEDLTVVGDGTGGNVSHDGVETVGGHHGAGDDGLAHEGGHRLGDLGEGELHGSPEGDGGLGDLLGTEATHDEGVVAGGVVAETDVGNHTRGDGAAEHVVGVGRVGVGADDGGAHTGADVVLDAGVRGEHLDVVTAVDSDGEGGDAGSGIRVLRSLEEGHRRERGLGGVDRLAVDADRVGRLGLDGVDEAEGTLAEGGGGHRLLEEGQGHSRGRGISAGGGPLGITASDESVHLAVLEGEVALGVLEFLGGVGESDSLLGVAEDAISAHGVSSSGEGEEETDTVSLELSLVVHVGVHHGETAVVGGGGSLVGVRDTGRSNILAGERTRLVVRAEAGHAVLVVVRGGGGGGVGGGSSVGLGPNDLALLKTALGVAGVVLKTNALKTEVGLRVRRGSGGGSGRGPVCRDGVIVR
mmetsp:Transcript_26871/g.63902  ORF Transcript_26871/g.63902 Transcript_26871/m.63902 type:complete len:784 (+) Transcript_26871:84-2435(+)